jgi:folate-binding protein YgfZ
LLDVLLCAISKSKFRRLEKLPHRQDYNQAVAITEVDLDAQYRLLREGAGLLRREGRRRVAVRGAEAADYLEGQLTNEVEALEPGDGCYAALLDRKGHMQGDMRLLRLADDAFELETETEAGDAIVRHLSMYKIGREVEVEDVSGAATTLSVIGPAAREVTGTGPLSPEHVHRAHTIAGVEARAVATDVGIDLIVPADSADAIADELQRAGAEPVTEAAAEIVRVESGRPRFGAEMTGATIPEEAGINERAVSFSKGCYIGQETVARLHYRGRPNRHLRGLRLSGAAEAGAPVRLGDRELGSIGTTVLSPAHGRIALAILRREAEPGATVTVGDGVEAELVDLPFV